MNNTTKIKIFLVDDDPLYLKLMEIEFLKHGDFDIKTFPTGELFIQEIGDKPDVVILDYHLDGIDEKAMNGMATLDLVKQKNPDIPVIMLSSQDKIEVAINCMHHMATDYVVKSETAFVRLQQIITNIFSLKKMQKELNWYMERM